MKNVKKHGLLENKVRNYKIHASAKVCNKIFNNTWLALPFTIIHHQIHVNEKY